MSNKIYVGNLSSKITDKQIFDLFSKYGKVTSARIIPKLETNPNMTYGYVTMSTDYETKKAIQNLDHAPLDDKKIRVMEAHPIDQEGHRYAYTRYSSKKHRGR